MIQHYNHECSHDWITNQNQIPISACVPQVMKGAASGGTDTVDASTTKRPVRDEAKHQAVVISVCSAAIAGLTALVAKSRCEPLIHLHLQPPTVKE